MATAVPRRKRTQKSKSPPPESRAQRKKVPLHPKPPRLRLQGQCQQRRRRRAQRTLGQLAGSPRRPGPQRQRRSLRAAKGRRRAGCQKAQRHQLLTPLQGGRWRWLSWRSRCGRAWRTADLKPCCRHRKKEHCLLLGGTGGFSNLLTCFFNFYNTCGCVCCYS